MFAILLAYVRLGRDPHTQVDTLTDPPPPCLRILWMASSLKHAIVFNLVKTFSDSNIIQYFSYLTNSRESAFSSSKGFLDTLLNG
jgi:hypothetical protein